MGFGLSKVGCDHSIPQISLSTKVDNKKFQSKIFSYQNSSCGKKPSCNLSLLKYSGVKEMVHDQKISNSNTSFLEKKKRIMPTSDFYRLADERAMNVPISFYQSKEQFVNYLIEPFVESVVLQLRVVWRWVTNNFEVIAGGCILETDNVPLPKDQCLKNKNLHTFAVFLSECTKELGLKMEIVSGWVKLNNTLVDSINNEIYHSWNAVYLDQTWWLLDVVWASGYLDADMDFIRDYNEHYFLCDPEEFIYDHYPKDTFWQLLDEPMSNNAFKNLPFYSRNFFLSQMKPLTHSLGLIECKETEKLHLKFKITKSNVEYFTILYDMANNEVVNEGMRLYTTEKLLHIFIIIPHQGEFLLKLFEKTSKNVTSLLCGYIVKLKQNLKFSVFPKQYKQFQQGYVLYSPLQGHLIIGEKYKFKIALPGAVEMVVCLGGANSSWIPIGLNKDSTWEGDVVITSGSERVTVVAKFHQKLRQTFSSVLEYQTILQE
ncbi:kyphoscoliosis peptidase isoform X1 [Hydra vulgaris]|uniref:kyphoscoliosis peptidase isoform X1 n=1 Tax=Hydra vulgaris TaxID=6087 RepID=UPI001F5FB2AA|nr:kyphoscoliosis peptidase [Hydra vulgaris]XP_047130031.1 kyphoscoliosis peptidase [Hydra vulgaris]XP_047130032.1 kyphoscoliosis peptidase [Hydra vulgaris]